MGDRFVRYCRYGVLVGLTTFCVPAFGAHAQTLASDVRSENAKAQRIIAVAFDNVSLRQALESIAQKAGLTPFYSVAVTTNLSRVTLHAHDISVAAAFEKVLMGTRLQASIVVDNVIFKRVGETTVVAQGEVVGTVVDAKTKQPLRGATITLDRATTGVLTGDDGRFRVPNVSPGQHTIRVKMLGYVKTAQTITVSDGQTAVVNMALEANVSTLDQIVVTGTIVATAQREVPNAMTVITAKQIEERGITRIDQLFRGDVPGLFVSNTGSNAFEQVIMFSRGVTGLTAVSAGISAGTNPIKTYLDGIELANPSYLSQLDPKSIERIEIVTGPQASTIYGSNAINGVMQVFTKRGTAPRPQVSVTLLSGLIQNGYSSALAPWHDDAAQVNGTEGHWSYNAGGSRSYMGPWTPAKATTRQSGFGGARLQRGPVTADATLRLGTTRTRQRSLLSDLQRAYQQIGWHTPSASGAAAPRTSTLVGQTLGLTLGYAPFSWWSHEVVVGYDKSDTDARAAARAYGRPSDTLLSLSIVTNARSSFRYATTTHVPLTSTMHAVVTLGADAWQNLTTNLSGNYPSLTGTLNAASTVGRQPGHNAGGFVQTQVSLWDKVFLTYGLRAEWNSNFGDEAQPNYAPRYGISYTQDWNAVTVKWRASYGRSTQPPQPRQKAAQTVTEAQPGIAPDLIPDFGNFNWFLANPELGPQHQGGGEGGVELYVGTRGSLVITRYNQVVDGIIVTPAVDSVRSFAPTFPFASSYDAEGYGYWPQMQYLNVGSLRNQGWELQGTMRVGPLMARGTYSWTKSRAIGVDARYRTVLTGSQYQPGASFGYLPEHTWAAGVTYARTRTSMGVDLMGTGMLRSIGNDRFYSSLFGGIRLTRNLARIGTTTTLFPSMQPAYIMADVHATRRFSPHIEGVLNVRNLTNFYRNDNSALSGIMGRQSQAGFRFRW